MSSVQALNLDSLLSLIRAQGIRVGAAEHQRVQQILQTQPQLSGSEFRDLLGTVLAKNEEQRKRIVFVFERFTRKDPDSFNSQKMDGQAPHRLSAHKTEGNEVSEDKLEMLGQGSKLPPAKKQKQPIRWIIGGLVIISLCLLVVFLHDTRQVEPPKTLPTQTKGAEKEPIPANIPKARDKQKALISDLPVWTVKSITITPRPIMREFIPAFALFLGSALGFVWLLANALKRTRKREPEPMAYQPALGYHTPAIKHSFYKLFSPQDQQTLAWGVGHYFDEDQQQRIDIDRSVVATANQGLPIIEFEPNRHEREVWLWQDRQNQSPLQMRLISEVTQLLKQANIHVKHGFFNGFPYHITHRDQSPQYQVIGALPQPVPLVMLCLDANNVNTCFSRYPTETEQTFQHLKQWSTLAVVDCNPTVASLKQTLKDYRLPYLLPTQVADWFAKQGEGKSHRKECVLNDVYRWACACALAQRIITEDEAYALHKALGLSCAWQYSHLSAYGQKVSSGLDFTTEQVTRINDLNEQDRILAVQFWQQRFEQIDKDLAHDNHYPYWQSSYAQYKEVRLPIALLGLWGEPHAEALDKAGAVKSEIDQLHDLFQHKDLQAPIKKHLGHYTCNGLAAEAEGQNHVLLPYDWQQLDAQSQQQLLAMGFAGQVKELKLTLDKPSSVLMGALAGLMLFGLHQSISVLWDKPPELRTHISSATPAGVVQLVNEDTIYLGTPKHSLEIRKEYKEPQEAPLVLEDNSIIDVIWSRKIVPAQENLISRSGATNGAQLWRLGTRRTPLPRPPNAKNQQIVASLAIITTKPDDMDAQALAAQLLDSGSADQVLITEKLGAYQKRFSNWSRFPDSVSSKQQVQRILIGKGATNRTENLTGVPNTLVFDGAVDELLAKFNSSKAGKQSPEQLRNLGFEYSGNPYLLLLEQATVAVDTPITLGQGMKLMPIPAGRFEMGSNNFDDEKPIHTVTISKPFWMSETEVTFEQYQAYTAAVNKSLPSDSGWGTGQRPVINVSWQGASDYTQWLSKTNTQGLSCRLPSEAEWEYAARAGSTTKFYWGNEPSRDFANYGKEECCDGVAEGNDEWVNTAPVKSFKPNQWGLYDMSGNVWEWIQDRYHKNYEGAPSDGSAWESGSGASRVLRGGSWDFTSFNVRSASRFGYGLGGDYVGFRVVCSPIDH